MNFKLLKTLIILIYLPFLAGAQFTPLDTARFGKVIDVPIDLSGTFGELRTNHFHSGIDIRTNQQEGYPVYAAADGYVYRIKVSAWGFGNALYLKHANGYITVYGHLQLFNDSITARLRRYQYKKQSFEAEFKLPANAIKVKKGDIIGYSGNTGMSGGPHLHFEVRRLKKEIPLNPMKFGFMPFDTLKPVIEYFMVYPELKKGIVNGQSFPMNYRVENRGSKNVLVSSGEIEVSGDVSFGISSYDIMGNGDNRNGLYNVEIWVDSLLLNSYCFDYFSFSESRYVNAFIDYKWWMRTGERIQRSKILSSNPMEMFKMYSNRGVYNFNKPGTYNIRYIISDYTGNTSELNVPVVCKQSYTADTTTTQYGLDHFYWQKENCFANHEVEIHLPKEALFEDIDFEYATNGEKEGYYSLIHQIHKDDIPLNKPILLAIRCDSVPEKLQSKLLIVDINPFRIQSEGGYYDHGFVKTNVRNFGTFAISIDTIAPQINPVDIQDNGVIPASNCIQFNVSDNLSGIGKYKAVLNGKWNLMEFDGKSGTMTCILKKENLKEVNQLVVTVEDAKQNSQTVILTLKINK